MKHSFKPTSDVIEAWSQSFVPEETLYWIDSSFLEDIPSSCLVIPRQEFFSHPLYRRPDITDFTNGKAHIGHSPPLGMG